MVIINEKEMIDLKHELEVTDKLLEEIQRVLDAIPECPSHGKCVPHALEWIEEMKAMKINKTVIENITEGLKDVTESLIIVTDAKTINYLLSQTNGNNTQPNYGALVESKDNDNTILISTISTDGVTLHFIDIENADIKFKKIKTE